MANRTPRIHEALWNALALVVATAFVGDAAEVGAASANYQNSNPALVVEGNSIRQSVDGLTITARGYTVDFDGTETFVYGPFPTAEGLGGRKIFGTGVVGQSELGLMSQPVAGINPSGIDRGAGLIQPGFDNHTSPGDNAAYPGPPLPSLEFALFEFSSPVEVSTVTVNDVSNFGRSVWVAGGAARPDFRSGLLAGLSGYTVQNSSDDATDGLFTHHLAGLTSISFLLVGAPAPVSVGDFGPIADGSSQFYVRELGFVPVIPEPSSSVLLVIGLSLVGVAVRRRSRPPARAAAPAERASRVR
jgi:hypothetical protein